MTQVIPPAGSSPPGTRQAHREDAAGRDETVAVEGGERSAPCPQRARRGRSARPDTSSPKATSAVLSSSANRSGGQTRMSILMARMVPEPDPRARASMPRKRGGDSIRVRARRRSHSTIAATTSGPSGSFNVSWRRFGYLRSSSDVAPFLPLSEATNNLRY